MLSTYPFIAYFDSSRGFIIPLLVYRMFYYILRNHNKQELKLTLNIKTLRGPYGHSDSREDFIIMLFQWGSPGRV